MSFSDFKEVNINNPGTATSYGADDILEIMRIFNGDVVSNRQVKVKNPWVWEDSFDLKAAASTPGNPAANSKRIYVEPSNNHLIIKSTSGALLDLDLLGSGTLTETSTSTLTNKTYNTSDNTLTATSQATGDLLKNNGTKFLRMARGTSLQVLRTNSGGTDLEWATPSSGGDVFLGASNTYGDFDSIFRSSRVKIRNPANTFSYILTGAAIAADRTVTYPLLTGNDIFVTEAFTQTVTNKTINATNNTITDTSTAAGDILKSNASKFVRMARGTSLQVLRTNSGATDLEWASLDSERVGKSTASGNNSTTVFNIAHGLGSTPAYAFISVADCGSSMKSMPDFTVDSTNIVVTFGTAPESGSNNVVIYWRVVAT